MHKLAGLIAVSLLACATDAEFEDARDDAFLTDDAKADAFGVEDWSPDGAAVLKLVSTATESKLHEDVGLSTRVAKGIIAKRTGLAHEQLTDLAQLDSVPYVGKTVFNQLLRYVTDHHMFKTALRVPLLIEDGDTKTPITTYNDKARAAGVPGFARYTFVTDGTHYADKMDSYDTRLQALATKAHITISGEMLVYAYGLSDFAVGTQKVCYIGDPMKVADVVGGLADDLVGDMYSVWAWRYKSNKWMSDDGEEQYGDDFANYRTSSDFVRLIYTNDDDGTHLATDDVPPCR